MNNGISIIIITYNRKDELKTTIDELLKQTAKFSWEVIIIDQNSYDGTDRLFEKENEKVIYKKLDKNYGVAGGRNIGAALAHYEFLLFIDDDSSIGGPESLSSIFSELMNYPEYNLFAFKIINLDGELYNWPYKRKKIKEANNNFNCKFFIGCGHVIRKSFFNLSHGYSEALFFWGEETELILKSVIIGAFPVLYLGNIEILHRVHGNGRNGNSNRFFYQVRNREYIIKELFPRYMKTFFVCYYRIIYFIKALRMGWIKEYCAALKDVKKLKIYSEMHLSFLQLCRYLFL